VQIKYDLVKNNFDKETRIILVAESCHSCHVCTCVYACI